MLTIVRPLENADQVETWARSFGFRDIIPAEWHVTIIKTHTPVIEGLRKDASALIVTAAPNRLVARMGGTIGLLFRSKRLERRHREFRLAGASWEHKDYRPHVTIAVDDRRALDDVSPFAGELVFGGEVWSPPFATG